MKKLITAVLASALTASVMAQGTINFKTSVTKNTVFYSMDDGATITGPIPTTGFVPGLGTVSYGILTAPTGTAPLTFAQMNNFSFGGSLPAGWTESALQSPVTYNSPGIIAGQTFTTPAASGAPGASIMMEVFAYTGSRFVPTAFGFSGGTFGGGNITAAQSGTGNATTTGALSWAQITGDPATIPGTPATLVAGSSGLGSIVVATTPEPGTIALGGLGATALLLSRRRK